jgi:uncharacterized protein YjbI with pentapeptide repeats
MKCFQKMNLEDSNFEGSIMHNAYFYGADLRWSYLANTDLRWADLSGADLRGLTWDDNTIWPDGYELVRKP